MLANYLETFENRGRRIGYKWLDQYPIIEVVSLTQRASEAPNCLKYLIVINYYICLSYSSWRDEVDGVRRQVRVREQRTSVPCSSVLKIQIAVSYY